MKKMFLSLFAVSALVLTPALRADDTDGTSVGQASNEGSSTAKSKTWQNVAIGAGAVAIAVTALVLVSNNGGHHHHHSHSHAHTH
jgi:shikimate 5-dehydrogenase